MEKPEKEKKDDANLKDNAEEFVKDNAENNAENSVKKFVHLHVHTEFSLLDGAAKIKELVAKTVKQGGNAVAITDHGNMYGVIEFYGECLAKKIKPIIGCEFYISNDLHKKNGKEDIGHIVLIAKNDEGYHNLLKLNSIAFVDGFYYKPRIDYKVLEQYSTGLICLSACLAGHIPKLILQNRMDEAEALALKLKNMFDDGDFYLEIQNHGIPEQLECNIGLLEISKKIDVKLVATNDVHYINKEDAEMQDVLMCVQMGKTIYESDRMKFPTNEFYLKSREEMELAFSGFEEALDATQEIANKCDILIRSKSFGDISGVDEKYVLPANQNYFPEFTSPDGLTNYEFLRKITYEGVAKKYKNITPETKERIETELSLINELGFVEYFLIVWDYIRWADEQNIPVGPGRGSGAGSVVAYCINIIRMDPTKHDLIFERFIHRERVSMPDFDVDFCYYRRGEVIEYTRQKYGASNVTLIVTFGTMAARNAVRDVARVLGVPYSEADKITKEIPFKSPDGVYGPVLKYYFGATGKSENDKYIIPSLRTLYESDDTIKKVVDMAIRLEGFPRNTSTHASGVLIAPDRVDNFVALSRNGKDITTQVDMKELESLGLLKMDFLGLRTLTDIDKTLKYIKELRGIDIDIENLNYEDQNVYELIGSGNTDAVFQLESGGMKKFFHELRPTSLEDIIAGIAMYRPGPMDSIPKYLKNKRNPAEIKYAHPLLENILNVTYGCIVYQEQVMKVFQVLGGYTLGQADNVRRIMGKKQASKMPAEKEKFIFGWKDPRGKNDIPGCIKLGVPQEVGEEVFSEMAGFASYAFNKSHAAGYAYLTFQTAYLKCYYEVEFLTAVLNNRITKIDEVKKYITHARQEKIKVLPPDINKSETYFSVEDGGIRFGIGALKNVGLALVDDIISERKQGGEFASFEDFVKRVSSQALNKKCLESLILSGAFDSFGHTRSSLIQSYQFLCDRIMKDKKTREIGQYSFFDNETITVQDSFVFPKIKEFNETTKLKFEKEYVGVYISGHPLNDYLDKFKDFTLTSDQLVHNSDDDETGFETDAEYNNIISNKNDYNGEADEFYDVESSASLYDGMPVTCGGILSEIKKLFTKRNKQEMAMVKLEDLYGVINIIIFPKIFATYRNQIIEDSLVTISGKISLRDSDGPIIICETITPWEIKDVNEKNKNDVVSGRGSNGTLYLDDEIIGSNNGNEFSEKIQKIQKLYLKFDTKNVDLYNQVKKVLKKYSGNVKVIIKCTSRNQPLKFPLNIRINNYLFNSLNGLLGEENIETYPSKSELNI